MSRDAAKTPSSAGTTPDQWLARAIGRYGGFLALLIVGLFWLAVRLPLRSLIELLLPMYLGLLLSVPIVGLTARHNVKRGWQTRASGWIQIGLALAATVVVWWTLEAGLIDAG